MWGSQIKNAILSGKNIVRDMWVSQIKNAILSGKKDIHSTQYARLADIFKPLKDLYRI